MLCTQQLPIRLGSLLISQSSRLFLQLLCTFPFPQTRQALTELCRAFLHLARQSPTSQVPVLANEDFHTESSSHKQDKPFRVTNDKHRGTTDVSCSHMMMMMMTRTHDLPVSL
jgi:hypothetical protein